MLEEFVDCGCLIAWAGRQRFRMEPVQAGLLLRGQHNLTVEPFCNEQRRLVPSVVEHRNVLITERSQVRLRVGGNADRDTIRKKLWAGPKPRCSDYRSRACGADRRPGMLRSCGGTQLAACIVRRGAVSSLTPARRTLSCTRRFGAAVGLRDSWAFSRFPPSESEILFRPTLTQV